jgi:hypothetical protein
MREHEMNAFETAAHLQDIFCAPPKPGKRVLVVSPMIAQALINAAAQERGLHVAADVEVMSSPFVPDTDSQGHPILGIWLSPELLH